jgi:hypothetical protein
MDVCCFGGIVNRRERGRCEIETVNKAKLQLFALFTMLLGYGAACIASCLPGGRASGFIIFLSSLLFSFALNKWVFPKVRWIQKCEKWLENRLGNLPMFQRKN